MHIILGLGLVETVWEDALVRIVEAGENGLLGFESDKHLAFDLVK